MSLSGFGDFDQFFESLNKETDRGAALVAASLLDSQLKEILTAFLIDSKATRDLLNEKSLGAPLGTFSARAAAALALGLIQENEFDEITIMRKIRNELGHTWQSLSFESTEIAELVKRLPWAGPKEVEVDSNARSRFNFAIVSLLTDLVSCVPDVAGEKRTIKIWPRQVDPPDRWSMIPQKPPN